MVVLLIIAILLVDQIVKIWVKTHMAIGDVAFNVSLLGVDWLTMTFLENNGAAGGLQIFGNKIFLSVFRIFASLFVGYYIWLLTQKKEEVRRGYFVCMALIFAGAVGNLIDCMFYGLVFNASSPYYLSYFVPFGTGYAPFLMGKVVDMFYFPLIETEWPLWMPFVGGEHFVFFSPVFNFADSCISVSVVWLLLFYREAISKMSLGKSVVQQEDQSDQEK
jgi:signal peptidase II